MHNTVVVFLFLVCVGVGLSARAFFHQANTTYLDQSNGGFRKQLCLLRILLLLVFFALNIKTTQPPLNIINDYQISVQIE